MRNDVGRPNADRTESARTKLCTRHHYEASSGEVSVHKELDDLRWRKVHGEQYYFHFVSGRALAGSSNNVVFSGPRNDLSNLQATPSGARVSLSWTCTMK